MISYADIIEWDVNNWSKALGFWDQHLPPTLQGSEALEIGARNGGLALFLALKGAKVVCSDLGGPTETAQEAHRRHGVDKLVTYKDVDATQIDFADATFDIVTFKSVLGGVGAGGRKDRQQKAVDEIYRVLKPGGVLLFAENLCGSRLHMLARKKFVRWGNEWQYMSIPEFAKLTSAFASMIFRTRGYFSVFGRSERQRWMLSFLDTFADPFLRASAKYIIYGYAIK